MHRRHPDPRRLTRGLLPGIVALCAVSAAAAQGSAPTPVYRCPGNPASYSNMLSPQEAKDKGCRAIEGAPITIVQAPRARSVQPTASEPAAARGGDTRVDPGVQRERDNDARRILADELRREEERLADLKRDYNGGEPERRGDERNYQRYLDRAAELKASIARKEADVAAIRRELGKLPP